MMQHFLAALVFQRHPVGTGHVIRTCPTDLGGIARGGGWYGGPLGPIQGQGAGKTDCETFVPLPVCAAGV